MIRYSECLVSHSHPSSLCLDMSYHLKEKITINAKILRMSSLSQSSILPAIRYVLSPKGIDYIKDLDQTTFKE